MLSWAHSKAFERDVCIVKSFGYGDNKKLKITVMKNCRIKGIETGSPSSRFERVNESKLDNNISRAKSKIFELAFCNPWTFFFTGTLDKSKYDRKDLEKYHKDLSQFFRDQSKKYGTKISWLVIPELHQDGESWHVHGLVHGLPEQALHQFQIGDTMGKNIAEKVKKGQKVFNWVDYSRKFGFSSLEYVRSEEAIAKYVTKYITEELGNCVTELGAHLYYHSRGLNTAEVIAKGYSDLFVECFPFNQADFHNDYVSIWWAFYSEPLIKALKEIVKLNEYGNFTWDKRPSN